MKIAFLGNHTVGVTALETIALTEEVVGVVAHPFNFDEEIRHKSVFQFAKSMGWPVIRGKGNDPFVKIFLRNLRPDLIWVTDYRYLLPSSILAIAKLGAINLHPSLLPAYRGRAPINWAILEGKSQLGLTAHFIDSGMDSGDIVNQVSYDLDDSEDVGDALDKLYPLYVKVTEGVLNAFRSGLVNRIPQDESKAFSRPARYAEDGLIDWNQSSDMICNLVRAVAAPYPGAFSYLDRHKVTVWKTSRINSKWQMGLPGKVIGYDDRGNPIISCGVGAIALTEFHSNRRISIGDIFGVMHEYK